LFNNDNNNKEKVTIKDFDLIKVLGRGAFGKVMLVKKKDSGNLYALKSIRKVKIFILYKISYTKEDIIDKD